MAASFQGGDFAYQGVQPLDGARNTVDEFLPRLEPERFGTVILHPFHKSDVIGCLLFSGKLLRP
ncbi:MAG: hypothetical protein RLZZ244_1859, partial [Verrucomicrobiota bacterium]